MPKQKIASSSSNPKGKGTPKIDKNTKLNKPRKSASPIVSEKVKSTKIKSRKTSATPYKPKNKSKHHQDDDDASPDQQQQQTQKHSAHNQTSGMLNRRAKSREAHYREENLPCIKSSRLGSIMRRTQAMYGEMIPPEVLASTTNDTIRACRILNEKDKSDYAEKRAKAGKAVEKEKTNGTDSGTNKDSTHPGKNKGYFCVLKDGETFKPQFAVGAVNMARDAIEEVTRRTLESARIQAFRRNTKTVTGEDYCSMNVEHQKMCGLI